jgi:hypothetical protein
MPPLPGDRIVRFYFFRGANLWLLKGEGKTGRLTTMKDLSVASWQLLHAVVI